MKKNNVGKGLMIVGSLRKAGITTYMKQGQLITRVSYSNQKRSNTRSQFIARQKMRHTIALWKMLKFCDVMFTQRSTAYQNFASLANRLPAVFVERLHMDQASFLMPGIPVSDGSLPTIQLQLGEVNGMPALFRRANASRASSAVFPLSINVSTSSSPVSNPTLSPE